MLPNITDKKVINVKAIKKIHESRWNLINFFRNTIVSIGIVFIGALIAQCANKNWFIAWICALGILVSVILTLTLQFCIYRQKINSQIHSLNSKIQDLEGNLKTVTDNRDGLIEQDDSKDQQLQNYRERLKAYDFLFASMLGAVSSEQQQTFLAQKSALTIDKEK